MIAAGQGNEVIVRMLILAKADPNVSDKVRGLAVPHTSGRIDRPIGFPALSLPISVCTPPLTPTYTMRAYKHVLAPPTEKNINK